MRRMTPFNSAETVPTGAAVTVLEGSTFCLSDAAGDIVPGLGLFHRDTRILSRWELRLDGQPAEVLSVRQPEAFLARFVLRRSPDLLLVRERLVDDGMRETITLDNLGRSAVTVELTLHYDADFADLFSVKEGRPVPGPPRDVSVSSNATNDAFVAVSATKASFVALGPGELSWRVVVPGRGRWATEVVVADRAVPPTFDRPARRLAAWRAANTTITASDPVLAEVLRRAESDLGSLRIEGFVAAGAPWYMTLFGRDSLLTAWMALPLDPTLALGTLQTLAQSQGTTVNPATEEEPGRIMHELRRGAGGVAALGGSHYYGTADATPLFVMLLAECWRWGADEDAVRALLPAADAALSWVDRHDGFVSCQRATDRGLVNQGWKDSADAINHAAGELAAAPIALCEVQGYVYAALRARAELGATDLLARAERLRERFAESFWLPDRGWYAVALDGAGQPVDALTSNAAHCLWTGIATDEHAAVLIERLAEPDMDSGFGLRTLASSMGAYHPMSYHNGSVWPHDTAIAVAGLLRYAHLPGAVPLAQRLADGLLDAAAAFGGRLPELYSGFGRDEFDPPVPYPTSCTPQAWASAAPLLLVRSFLGLAPHVPRRTVTVAPRLPARWEVTLSDLRLGPATVTIAGHGDSAEVTGFPADWSI
jgi:glycogen debranching enzyme